jgi:uncharacterized protein with ParB-like and HNH nuclease domain
VIVPDHATASTIFETLNDRGIALAISDLLKNFLFTAAEDSIDQAQAYWPVYRWLTQEKKRWYPHN